MTHWYIIMATGIVQAVYGSALLDMAKAKLPSVPMGTLFLAPLNGKPHVGMRITPQMDWQVIA